jgi:hypothetical protein
MTQMLTVTANAVLAVPDGFTLDPDKPALLRAPNGESYKFWVAVELYTDSDGDEALLDLSHDQLVLRDMHLEHDASILNLAPESVA